MNTDDARSSGASEETLSHLSDSILQVDREGEAERLAEFILRSDSDVVVIYGRPAMGKTELVTRRVFPLLLESGRAVYYGEWTGAFPPDLRRWQEDGPAEGEVPGPASALGEKSVVVLDGLDTLTALPRSERERLLVPYLEEWQSGERLGALVFLASHEDLGSLFELQPYLPEITGAVTEIGEVSVDAGMQALTRAAEKDGFRYEDGLLEALAEDLTPLADDEPLDPELFVLLHERMRARAARAPEATLSVEGYRGLSDLLHEHLRDRLSRLGSEGEPYPLVAEAALREIVSAEWTGELPNWTAFSNRHDIGAEECREILELLESRSDLVRQHTPGRYRLVPRSLVFVIDEIVDRISREIRPLSDNLEQAVVGWQELDVLMPSDRYRRIWESRRDLAVSPDEIELLLRCALNYDDPQHLEQVGYWLRRMGSPAELDSLLQALGDRRPRVRSRAALALRRFPRPEVANQLYLAILEDSDEEVRESAISGLRGIRQDTEMERLEEIEEIRRLLGLEIVNQASPHRIRAIKALRIFEDPETCAELAALVSEEQDADVRNAAISVLSGLGTTESVDALLDIALHHEHFEARRRAARELSAADSESCVRHLLTRLRESVQPRNRKRAGARWRRLPKTAALVSLTILICLGNLVLHGLALVALRRVFLGGALLLVQGLAVLSLGSAVDWSQVLRVPTRIDLEALAVVAADNPGAALTLLATALLAQLLPLGLLLRRRWEAELPEDSLERYLYLPLLITNLPTGLLAVHGWVQGWVGEPRKAVPRALGVFFAELTGLGLIGLQPYYLVLGLSRRMIVAYVAVGVLLFIGSYVADLVRLGAVGVARRKSDIYRNLVGNRVTTDLLLGASRGQSVTPRLARGLIRTFGSRLHRGRLMEAFNSDEEPALSRALVALERAKTEKEIEELESMYGDAPRVRQRRIVSVLAGHPTQRSVESLAKLRPRDWWAKLRYVGSWVHLRLSLTPSSMILGVVVALPLAVAIFVLGMQTILKPEQPFVRKIDNQSNGAEERSRWARALAHAMPKEAIPILSTTLHDPSAVVQKGAVEGLTHIGIEELDAVDQLDAVQALIDGLAAAPDAEVRSQIVRSLARTAVEGVSARRLALDEIVRRASDPDLGIRDAALVGLRRVADLAPELLTDELVREGLLPILMAPTRSIDDRTAMVMVLEILGSEAAVDALRQFMESTGQRAGVRQIREAALENRAKDALVRTGTLPAYRALARLRDAAPQGSERRREFATAAAQTEPLAILERLISAGLYEHAVRLGEKLRTLARDPAERELLRLSGSRARNRLERLLAESYAALASLRLSEGQLDFALDYAARSLELDPDSFAHKVMGLIQYNLGDLQAALASFGAAAELDPADPEPHIRTASIHLEAGSPGLAEPPATRAIELDPERSEGYWLLLDSLHDQGDDERAIETFEELKVRYPDRSGPVLGLMYLYHEYRSDEDTGAYLRAYEEAQTIVARPDLVDALFLVNYVEICASADRHDEALEAAENAVERIAEEIAVDPSVARLDAPLQTLIYISQVLTGDYDAALEQLASIGEAVRSGGFRPSEASFTGTRRRLQRRDLPPEIENAILAVLDVVESGSRAELEQVLEEKRNVLKRAGRNVVKEAT